MEIIRAPPLSVDIDMSHVANCNKLSKTSACGLKYVSMLKIPFSRSHIIINLLCYSITCA